METQPADKRHNWPKLFAVLQQTSWRLLFSSVDIASLVYFRIAFGVIMLWEVWRYFTHHWIERYWIDPIFNFTYYGFDWVQPWPGKGMYLHFVGLGILAVFITLGLWYRISTVLFFLGFTYIFLLEKARYLNHFYLICLISFLLIFIPAHRIFSIDAWRHPSIRNHRTAAWTVWMLRLQIGIPYFYGGLAKLNSDWLQGEPMRMWMATKTDFPLIGSLFTEEWMIYLLSYGGLLLDLFVVPFLLWRRTRPFAFAAAVIFHLMNARLFSIGIFPWFMIAATAIFFPPDWPRRLLGQRQGAKIGRRKYQSVRLRSPHAKQSLTLALLGIYLSLQLLIPLRHFLYPGNVSWTEEGHRFAWHMKLRSKKSYALFKVSNGSNNKVQLIKPEDFLPRWQARKMATRPDMILQFSHFLAEEIGKAKSDSVEVRAEVFASLNDRKYQRLIDPNVDLSQQQQTLLPANWILPLETPLSRR
ncbi:MAG: HTTM domain-containing protein [Xenococcus sp. MO_188.B8]|nr:HTTM domain-containing protein [Xenococcus sp. MO_188.B8]